MKVRLSVESLFFFLVIYNPILSFLFDSTQIYYHYLLYPIIMILILIKAAEQKKLFYCSICICISVAFCELTAILFDSPLGKLNNHLFNYTDAILLMLYISNINNIYSFIKLTKKNINKIGLIVLFINCAELIMLLKHQGYVYVYSWHGTFFQGSNSMPHTLSYLMLATIIFVIVYTVITRKKVFALMAIIPSYCVFLSGARVSLLLCVVLDAILVSFTLTEKQKSIIVKFIKIAPWIVAGLFIFRNKIFASDVMAKIITRSKSGNLSAGRTYMWNDLLSKYINESNIIQYFLGQGDDKSYYFNQINPLVGVEVWAHNDIVQVIIGKGLVGLFIYTTILICFFNVLIKRSGNIYTYAIIFFIIVAMLLNGFYSYRDVNLCIPFFIVINELLSYKGLKP